MSRTDWQGRAMRSARSAGAVGLNPLCYRRASGIMQRSHRVLRVLDFGAGKEPVHAQRLARKYPHHVVEWHDLHPSGCSDPVMGLSFKSFDLVIASNVLNVIEDQDALLITIDKLSCLTLPSGMLVCNYPKTPRYLGLSEREIEFMLSNRFESVDTSTAGHGVILASWPRA